ncbi:MAG: hypothetical protein ACOYEV_19910 [Candidatus Nanopelagicales bacterium]
MTTFIHVETKYGREIYVSISATTSVTAIAPDSDGCILYHGHDQETHVKGVTADAMARKIEELLEDSSDARSTNTPQAGPGYVRIPRRSNYGPAAAASDGLAGEGRQH